MCADVNYYSVLSDGESDDEDENETIYQSNIVDEVAGARAGIGRGFENTNELKVLNYKQAMVSKDKLKWKNSIYRNVINII